MTCSTSSSSRWLAVLASLALAGGAGAAAPAGAPARSGLATRVALFPIANLSGGAAPVDEVATHLEAALRARGVALLAGDAVDAFLARHRIRYTGGLDLAAARAARDDLGVDAVLVPSLTLFRALGVPAFGMAARLVSAGEPGILWMDRWARTGDDAPGLFGTGVVGTVPGLRDAVVAELADGLVARLRGAGPRLGTCAAGVRYEPLHVYAAAPPRREGRLRVAVVPFVDETRRGDAGELMALDFVRELARHRELDVLEPGLVRAELLEHRVVMEGGVSHETARIALATMEVDVVVAGYVRLQEELPVPRLELTVLALDTFDNRVLWRSSSHARGDDGVILFDVGRVTTTSELSCRLVRATVDRMVAAWRRAAR
jgi:TolB-like protein